LGSIFYCSIVLRRSFQKVAGTVGIASVRAVGMPLGAKPIFPLHVISNACNVEIHVSFQIVFFPFCSTCSSCLFYLGEIKCIIIIINMLCDLRFYFLLDHDTCIGGITCDGEMGPNAWFCGMSCQEVENFFIKFFIN
jgi:hypothetical protein